MTLFKNILREDSNSLKSFTLKGIYIYKGVIVFAVVQGTFIVAFIITTTSISLQCIQKTGDSN